ncbi:MULTISPECIES: AAA family ATPase [unclassified Pseudomonas]|uniref:AAA family ATPase n=1 Tax=unclassified Pseudomonas TaxID=196821 RepID=UPI000C88A7EB|nr:MULTISPECIES: ATP-binding protein [unclassified Pseudomonas]PMZ85270.1 ATP-binding protein [Pseudomonas sp. FW215-T2]PNA08309.1 ATP-binding protein [Pseudomonas sp. FW215-R3]PNB34435.1 ATP-binding protein [Pseudomonas sp. FW305-131]
MYIRRLNITNIRSIKNFDLRFSAGEAAGWHVILGANGSGKSSVVRSLALALAGPKEAVALRQNWNTWQRNGAPGSKIQLQFDSGQKDIFTGKGRPNSTIDVDIELRPIETSIGGPRIEVAVTSGVTRATRSIWGTNSGWFSASFGPFRRFTGGDQAFDRLFYSNPRLASHLSAFGEDVALTEGLRWLRELRVKQLEGISEERHLLDHLIEFLNNSDLLPHGAKIVEVKSEEVVLSDANGAFVSVEQMSDGYRSVLSMIFEILRQMTKSYGIDDVIRSLDVTAGAVNLPGVVSIDEVDAHLHPSWQKEIGPWFTKCFPQIQFIVTTHSPIICRNATTVWRLPNPGTEEKSGRIEGNDLNRLMHGSILEAYGTEFFGRDIARSEDSQHMLSELATLNRGALKGRLNETEKARMDELRAMFPTRASDIVQEQ